eukprot:TRINITY_DN6061_c0_g4_i2.p1 TRINITY_DN6061_c0_g4~~TRINITY_DN6061_c0_g4_i2.p1  ORF type:complete len:420 (+),score=154.44 TRINITY_DN6061_c0_g4_i2:142-1260(+)
MKLEGKWRSIETLESVRKIQRFFRIKNFQTLVEKQMFISKNRGKVVQELMSTEKTYLVALYKLQKKLIEPLRQIRKTQDTSANFIELNSQAPTSPRSAVNNLLLRSSGNHLDATKGTELPESPTESPQLYFSPDSSRREEEAPPSKSKPKAPVGGFRSLSVQDLLKKFEDKTEPEKEDATHCFDNETEEETVAFLQSCFDNIEDIIKLQSEFFGELEKRMLTWTPSRPFADIFVNHVPQMILYTEYINNYDRMMASIDILSKKNKSFKAMMDKIAQDEGVSAGGKYIIMDLSITPIQRMPRYQLLWSEILKLTPSYHLDHENVREGLKKVIELNKMINENKRLHEAQLIEAKRLSRIPLVEIQLNIRVWIKL